MFRKTIQNIENTRVTGNTPMNYPQSDMPTGYNTQRYDRYPPMLQQPKPSQRKNISSGQFSQLKKMQANKTSQLVIRQCDLTQINHYKKPLMRPIEENIYPYQFPSNSSNKKQRLPINPRQKTYDSNFKQPLEEIHFSDRDNKSQRYSTGMDPFFELQQQVQAFKQFIIQSQNQQSNEVKKLKTIVNQVQVDCMGQLENVATQVSCQLNKQKQDMLNMNKRGIETQRQLRYLKESFNSFVKDNEQKMESLVLDMNGGNNKKSKTNEEFGVDLKSSTHCITGGVGTSMSVNFQNDNINLKLYNQTSAQLQMLKSQLQQCKQKIQILEKDTKILQLERKNSKDEFKETVKQKIDLKEVQKMIIEKFSQERKKNSFSEKIQDLDLKTKDLYKVYQDIDSNIKGMNAQFTRVINGTVIKKEKMLEAKLIAAQQKINQLQQKFSSQQLIQTLKPQLQSQLAKILEQKSSPIKTIKIRQPTSQQKTKLQTIKNPELTYLVDEEGHLLDSSGNYIVQTLENGSKQRIKIEKNVMYLLESQGIEIKSA